MTVQIASHSQADVSYTVTIGPRSTACTCPDWTKRRGPGCPQEGTDCKHIRQQRAERFEHLRLLAGSLEDSELSRLIEKYQPLAGQGKGDVWFALICERTDREALEVVTEQPVETPAAEEVPASTPARYQVITNIGDKPNHTTTVETLERAREILAARRVNCPGPGTYHFIQDADGYLVPTEQPASEPAPALPAILERARAFGRAFATNAALAARLDARAEEVRAAAAVRGRLENALDNARARKYVEMSEAERKAIWA